MKLVRMAGSALGALLALGCGNTVVIPIRGHGGATGIRLSVEGDLSGTAVAPGIPQSRLDEQITFPAPFWLCPASSVVWGRQAETTWSVMGCAPGTDLVWSGALGTGAKIEKIELDFGEPTGSLYVLLYLDRDPWSISTRIQLPAPTTTSGSVTGTAVWESFAGGAESREVGRSTLRLEWAFDPAVKREWTGTGRGH